MALEAMLVDIALDEHHSTRLVPFTRTELAGELPKVSRTVLARGEVIITSHNRPEMVLMTVDRYRELQEASRPSLKALDQEFEALFQSMQTPASREGAQAAFGMRGDELGQIALRAAQSAQSSTD